MLRRLPKAPTKEKAQVVFGATLRGLACAPLGGPGRTGPVPAAGTPCRAVLTVLPRGEVRSCGVGG